MRSRRCPPPAAVTGMVDLAATGLGEDTSLTHHAGVSGHAIHRACLCALVAVQTLPGCAPARSPAAPAATAAPSEPTGLVPAVIPAAQRDGQHDFDFEIGSWKTKLSRLERPLTGSTTWVQYEGTSVVRKIWDGRANLVELVVDGPAGRIEGLNLRLYNPTSHQWSLYFASSRGGVMSPPTTGRFENGRGEFYGQETFDDRVILVRFVISEITASSCRFEQAFSEDGGKTWEVNWIAVDTRVAASPGHGVR